MEGLQLLKILIKYFFLTLAGIYCYQKMSNLKFTNLQILKASLYSALSATIILFVREYNPVLIPLLLTVFVAMFCKLVYKTDFKTNLCLSILSVSVTFFLFASSPILLSPLFWIGFKQFGPHPILDLLLAISLGTFQLFLIYFFFHLNRFKNGLPDIELFSSSTLGIFVSIMILLIEPLFFLTGKNAGLTNFLILFVVTLGLIIFLWSQKYTSTCYLVKTRNKSIEGLEATIQAQQLELDQLSKLIHKDNKLLAALEVSVRETLLSNPTEEHYHLLDEISELSKGRSHILQSFEKDRFSVISKTNIFSIDMILNFFSRRAMEEDIYFDVSLLCNVKYLVSNVITVQDFNTILSDLLENAFIATKGIVIRKVLLVIGVVEETYYFSVYDNGPPFDNMVLMHLGKERYTTHKSHGGSGIGLMTVCELLKKYKASFEIKELTGNSLYTKQVSVYFDSLLKIRM